jgi:hypothetical protein
MRAVIRRIFFLASLLSLLLCVVTTVLWITGHSNPRTITRNASYGSWSADLSPGSVTVLLAREGGNPNAAAYHEVLGFMYLTTVEYPTDAPHPKGHPTPTLVTGIRAPCSGLAVLFAVLPISATFVALAGRRSERTDVGESCFSCLYNLTGNTSGTCPECGSPVTPHAKPPETECPRPA